MALRNDLLNVVVLAAGQGKRMQSNLPKVLQPLAGQPMLAHVLKAARDMHPARLVVIYGQGGDLVRAAFPAPDIVWTEQSQQLGTGHALAVALPACCEGMVLVLYGDCPLIDADLLAPLLEPVRQGKVAVLAAQVDNPQGYGRVVRNEQGQVLRIVEQKDASARELAIREINTGFMAAPLSSLQQWLPRLRNDNAQGEYYLTDIVALAVADGVAVEAVPVANAMAASGVNDKAQLAVLERYYQQRQAQRLLASGVTLLDPARFDLRGSFRHGRDVEIDINVILEGDVVVGNNVRIGPHVVLRNAVLGDDVVVGANTVIEASEVGNGCDIGPFARLRPGTRLAEKVHIGNFVELKQATLGAGTKAGHLAYLGNATIGERVNISAGVITCNYDGANKHQTTIGDDAFIGTDSQLVAPVTIGERAYVAAGSTITVNAPADALSICRARGQKSIPGWQRPKKSPKE